MASMAFSSGIFAEATRLLPRIAASQPIAQRKQDRGYFNCRPEVPFCFGGFRRTKYNCFRR